MLIKANRFPLILKPAVHTIKRWLQWMKGLEKGMSNKDVAAKHGLPESTVSTIKWKKRKTENMGPWGGGKVCI